jgi:hypothetical protein
VWDHFQGLQQDSRKLGCSLAGRQPLDHLQTQSHEPASDVLLILRREVVLHPKRGVRSSEAVSFPFRVLSGEVILHPTLCMLWHSDSSPHIQLLTMFFFHHRAPAS